MILNKPTLPTAVLLASILPQIASAADDISVNGFGSIVATQTLDNDESLYNSNSDLSLHHDSRFALQFIAPISDKTTATAQILARGENQYEPTFEWAYLSFQATDSVTLMFGRQRFNLYKYSDYVDVGYAYNWVRPPQGVYSLPFNSGNGIGFLYSNNFDDLEFNASYKFIGEEIADYVPSGTKDNEQKLEPARFNIGMSHLVNLDLAYHGLNVGINYGAIPKLTYEAKEIQVLEAGLKNSVKQKVFTALGTTSATASDGQKAQADALANTQIDPIMEQVRVNDETLDFMGAYAGYDSQYWFLEAEYSVIDFAGKSAFADQDSLYLVTGIKWDQLTLHATYGKDKNTLTSDVYETVSTTGLSAVDAAKLKDTLKIAVSTQEEDSTTYSLGARYELEPGVAVKLDYTQYDDKNDAKDAQLVSAAIDFVF